jgi:hypothetical protein
MGSEITVRRNSMRTKSFHIGDKKRSGSNMINEEVVEEGEEEEAE